jgi:hypothetical protein
MQFWMKKDEMMVRVNAYRKDTRTPNRFVFQLETALGHASSFTQMVLTVTEFQRCYLELYGLLDYLEIYQPRMESSKLPATTVADSVGTITVIPHVVQDFFQAGIPVWFIQPCLSGPFPHNVLNVVTPFEPVDFLSLDKPDPPFPVIYDGDSNIRDRYDAYYHFLRTRLVFKDPFEDETPSTTTPSTTCVEQRPHSEHRVYLVPALFLNTNLSPPNQSAGQDKFLPLSCPLAPFTIPAWGIALQAVDRSPSRLVKTSKHFGHYAFPDPGLLVTPTTNAKKAKFIETWVRAHDAWIVRIVHEKSLAMSGQHWRDFLATDFSKIPTVEDSKSAKRRRHALQILQPKFMSHPDLKTRSVVGEALVWQGNTYPPNELPPERIVREISMSSTSIMNSWPWTVVLAKNWTCRTIFICSNDKA